MPLNAKGSAFVAAIKTMYNGNMGQLMAERAADRLLAEGINPAHLMQQHGGFNTKIFSLNNALIFKVGPTLENHLTEATEDPAILKALQTHYLGEDMGGCAVHLKIYPRLHTAGVKPEHTKALCHSLSEKGLLFRDNKCENVGLTRSGIPYVIDDGATVPARSLSPLEKHKPYLYPTNSGYSVEHQRWDVEATHHKFVWPQDQNTVPEVAEAKAFLQALQQQKAGHTK